LEKSGKTDLDESQCIEVCVFIGEIFPYFRQPSSAEAEIESAKNSKHYLKAPSLLKMTENRPQKEINPQS
jgi:hypothetical protein